MGRGVDYLTCGRCLKEFQLQDIIDFIQHKKVDCDESEKEQDASIKHLYCSSCSKVFLSAWSLLKHAQFSHKFPLFHNVDNDVPTPELKPSSVLYKNKARDRKSGKEEVLLPMDPHCNWEGDGTDGSTDCEYLNRKDYRMTVIPRIPEKPKKCCNAVIPKKRKHHMETKHVSSVESSRNQKRKGLPELSTSYQNEIYIDLEPGNQNMAAPTDREEDKNELFSYSTCSSHSENSTLNRMVSNTNDMNKNKSRSFIIHPRSVFSIPFSCTIVSEPATSSVTSVPMSSVHSVDSATIVSCRSGSRTTQASTQQLSPASAQQNVPQPAVPPNPTIPGNHAQQGPDGVSEPLSQSSGNFGDGNNPFSGRQGRKRKYPTSRPFKCDLCDNAFNQRIHLKKHLSKHTGVKPYKCHQCDYSTVERSHLKVHIRIHTGEKPFKCTFCEYATAQNSTLKIHLKRHHSGRMFKCKCCGKSFTQKNLLKSHEVNHHSQHQQPLVLDNSNSPSPQPLTGTNNNC